MKVLIQMIDPLTTKVIPVTIEPKRKSSVYDQGGFIPNSFEDYRKLNKAFLNFPKDIDPSLAKGEVVEVVFTDPLFDKAGTTQTRAGVNIRFTRLDL